MRGLKDKIVVVTGGGGGIGGATCRRFVKKARKSRSSTLTARRPDCGGGHRPKPAEGSGVHLRHHQARRLSKSRSRRRSSAWGPIDVLVNNAGWDVFRLFIETSPADWDKIISINLTGALNMHHAVLPGMVERKRGRIVNVSSDAARVGSSGEAVYAACKAG